MSLREMVTGSDACTTSEGAGPSNAFAGLANTVLGTSSKDQERLKEVSIPSQIQRLQSCQSYPGLKLSHQMRL